MTDRRAEIRAGSSGVVVDLADVGLDGLEAVGAGSVDTVLAIDQLPATNDPDRLIRAIERALANEGRFGFVERDVDYAAVIRRNGLFVTDLWRIARDEVAGWARRPTADGPTTPRS